MLSDSSDVTFSVRKSNLTNNILWGLRILPNASVQVPYAYSVEWPAGKHVNVVDEK